MIKLSNCQAADIHVHYIIYENHYILYWSVPKHGSIVLKSNLYRLRISELNKCKPIGKEKGVCSN